MKFSSRVLLPAVMIVAAAAALALVTVLGGHQDLALIGAMAVQTAYNERMAVGVPGMPASMSGWDADSLICEEANGIGFGVPVGQGSADNGGILAGALNLFRGVSYKDITLLNAENADEYPQNNLMGVMFRGDIWVRVSVAVLPSDPVHYNATTGAWLITGGSGPIVGARWMTAAGIDGIAKLRLSGNVPVA